MIQVNGNDDDRGKWTLIGVTTERSIPRPVVLIDGKTV